jgi:aminopeptidase N
MYPKGGNMLHTIRHSINNDDLFRKILRGLNAKFYHQTVTAQQVEDYMSEMAGYDYHKVFEQYLTTTQVPKFEYYFSNNGKQVSFRYTNCVTGFNLPLALKSGIAAVKIDPVEQWKSLQLNNKAEAALFNAAAIEKMYYITPSEVQKPVL